MVKNKYYETKVNWGSLVPEMEDFYTPGEITEIKKEKKKTLEILKKICLELNQREELRPYNIQERKQK